MAESGIREGAIREAAGAITTAHGVLATEVQKLQDSMEELALKYRSGAGQQFQQLQSDWREAQRKLNASLDNFAVQLVEFDKDSELNQQEEQALMKATQGSAMGDSLDLVNRLG